MQEGEAVDEVRSLRIAWEEQVAREGEDQPSQGVALENQYL